MVVGGKITCLTTLIQIVEKLGITVQKPRTYQVQPNRAVTPAETIEDHYREISRFPRLTIWSMSWKIDLAVVTHKQQQCNAYLLFRQCCWHQKKHGWHPLAGFSRSMKIRCPDLWALMLRGLYGKESGMDKILRPPRQLGISNFEGDRSCDVS